MFSRLLRLRLRMFRRRHGNLLNLLIAVGAVWLAWYGGTRFAAARPAAVLLRELGAVLSLGAGAALLLFGADQGRRLRSPEANHFLLTLPIGAATLSALQLLVASLQGLACAVLCGAFLAGATGIGALPLFRCLAIGLGVAALAPLGGALAGWLRQWTRGFPTGLVLYPLGFALIALALRSGRSFGAWVAWGEAGPLGPALCYWSEAGWLACAGVILLAGAGFFAGHRVLVHSRAPLVSAALSQETSPRGRLWRLLRALSRPLPRALGSLWVRDIVLLAGRGYARMRIAVLLMLAVYPVYHQIVRGFGNPTAVELVSGAHTVFLVCFAAYFLCLDFWKFKADGFAVERAQPVSGRTALWGSLLVTAPLAVLLALLLAPIAAPETTARLELGLKGGLLAALLSHFFASFCLENYRGPQVRGESALSISAAVLGIVLAGALRLHPLLALAYPLLVGRSAARARRNYERVELSWM